MRALLVMLTGCALVSKSPPRELRYFEPQSHAAELARAPAAEHAQLRIGRVTPGALLRERIVYRESSVELDRYETLRWTDVPDVYVRRALATALFDARSLEPADGGAAPVLDVDVIAFEEVRHDARRLARIELRYTLEADTRVLARGTVAIERDAHGPAIEQIVTAIGIALDAAAGELADRVVRVLCRP